MDEITLHYGSAALLDSIVGAIGEAGIDLSELTVDHLGPVDEFHIGGRAATEGLMERARILPGSRILDVGSGVGGTARFLAANGLHSVTGVDLTPEYVETASALTDLVGLDGSVEFHLADVLDLPLKSSSFDVAVMLHVGMNIEDKASAFSEVARVLVDGGLFVIYDIMGPRNSALEYPVPWAGSAAGSFLATIDEYVDVLEATGFEVKHVGDRSESARQFFSGLRHRKGPPPHLGLHLLMGDEAPVRYGNMVDGVETGAMAPVEIIAYVQPQLS